MELFKPEDPNLFVVMIKVKDGDKLTLHYTSEADAAIAAAKIKDSFKSFAGVGPELGTEGTTVVQEWTDDFGNEIAFDITEVSWVGTADLARGIECDVQRASLTTTAQQKFQREMAARFGNSQILPARTLPANM